jgi:hypothetical protein
MREVAWHHGGDGRIQVDTYAAACDCPAGDRLAQGSMARWVSFADRLAAKANTHAVYHTSSSHPALSNEERFAPDVAERLRRYADLRRSA